MDPYKKICPNCFRGTFVGKVCSHCHFDINSIDKFIEPLPPHTVLHNRYLIGKPLGQGGFGITYKSFDLKEQKIVVVKENFPITLGINRKDLGHIPTSIIYGYRKIQKRFIEEAAMLKELSKYHYRYIVQVSDMFDECNTNYYVMEYLDGKSLNNYLGKLSADELLSMFVKIAGDLSRLHKEHGLLHRDISPGNIMITKNLHPTLIDFGAAKFVAQDEAQTNTVLLKEHFAPIEQRNPDAQQGPYTDVYALAATLYYMLTKQYVPDPSLRRTDNEHCSTLKELNIPVSQKVSDAVEWALVVEPEKRMQTMDQFIQGIKNDLKIIIILVSEQQKKRYKIKPNSQIKVGRNKDNHIIIDNKVISKHHLTISYEEDTQYFLVKDHSTNGIYINNKFYNNQSIALKKGKIIFPAIDDYLVLEVENG
ncbi:MAG TPA: hypothetical protein DCL24_08980 [Erysipelotrichaceae bacterium]|nr:hypothetical protein [Erysipelotrichaceae bacterium]